MTSSTIRFFACAAARGATLVPSFDDPWIIEGQGSAALEAADPPPALRATACLAEAEIALRRLRTADAVSPVAAPAVGASLLAFIAVYTAVFMAGTLYMLRIMARPPHDHEPGPAREIPQRAAADRAPRLQADQSQRRG